MGHAGVLNADPTVLAPKAGAHKADQPSTNLAFITCLIVLILFCAHVLVFRAHPFFEFDDSYITLQNALALFGKGNSNYSGAPALAGSTSVIHTVLIGILSLILPAPWAMLVSLWMGILLYAFGVVRLCVLHRISRPLTWLVLFVALAAGGISHQLLNGLETGLAMAAITWALCFASEAQPSRMLPIVCGQLPFIRPELALLSLLLLAMQASKRWTLEPPRRATRNFLGDIAMMSCAALPWVLLLFVNTGSVVPSSISAKRYFFAEAYLPTFIKKMWVWNELRIFLSGMGFLSLFALFLLLNQRAGGDPLQRRLRRDLFHGISRCV